MAKVGEKDNMDVMWLVNTPLSDVNFTGALERVNVPTLKAALEELEANGGAQGKKLAIARRLRKIAVHGESPTEAVVTDQAVVETANRQERTVGMELATLQQDREFESQQVELQNEKEQDIARAYETAGIIKGLKFVEKVVTVTTLVQLDLVKKSKGYRGIGTWQDYCNHLGLDRHTIDQCLKNLHTFGEEFLVTVTNFGVSHRDMRKLRQLANEGTITIDAECVTIGEETIPINEEHAPDIQTAIEHILQEREKVNQRLEKLEKHKDELVKEETKGLKEEVKALVKEVKRLKPFDPEEKDLSFCADQLQEIKDATLCAVAMMGRFICDDRVKDQPAIMGQVEGHLQAIDLALSNLRRTWEQSINLYEA